MRISGSLLAFTAAFLFGISGVVAASAFAVVDPFRVAQVRSVLAAGVLMAVAAARRRTAVGGRAGGILVFGGFLAAVTIAYYFAIDRLGVGPGVTLQFLGPVLVLGWMRIAQKRVVPARAWAAAASALLGTALITRIWNFAELDLLGMLAGLAAAVTFAGYLLVGESLGRDLPGLTITAWGFAVSAVILWVVNPAGVPDVGTSAWAQLLWIGLGGTAAPFLLEVAAVRRDDPGKVGVIATTEPVVAAVTAWIFLGQTLQPLQLLGGLLTVAGVAVIQALTHSVAPDVPQSVA